MCSVSTVKNPVALANLYRLQSIATDNKKTMHSVPTVLGPSSFFFIRRFDIGVVSHLLGQFAKNRSRWIFIDGSITPCLFVWDSHTPSSVAPLHFSFPVCSYSFVCCFAAVNIHLLFWR